MILRPQLDEIKTLGYYIGKITIGIGILMLIPLGVAILFREINPLFDFLIGALLSCIVGVILITFCYTPKDLSWMQGMIVVSLSWVTAMFLGAAPLYLSGHWKSYLDACFEAMSGFATTGLILVQDLDHLSFSHNMWRHLTMFIGGQGIVVIALTFFVRGISGAFKMYVGEAREERVLPNVIHTARFIWLVSLVYLSIGTLALGVVGFLEGLPPLTALFHGMWVFMAAFDTGGFAPQSQNILYYHSLPFEITGITIMLLGAINFKLHYALWTGNKREIYRNIETVTLFISVMATFLLVACGLAKLGLFPQAMSMFRKGFYQLISGHTGCGHTSVYAKSFLQWGPLALVATTIAMAIGGSACSTTGAIKTLRVGLIFKALTQDVRKIMLPESAVLVQKFHHIKDIILEERQTRSALIICLSYLVLYFLGAIVGMFLGYPFLESLFESTSAAANVGLSCGITTASMPAILKVTYIIQMWAGRLEFMSIFTLMGFIVAAIKGK